jgi:hypothetical protein
VHIGVGINADQCSQVVRTGSLEKKSAPVW